MEGFPTSYHRIVSDISLKLEAFDYISVAESLGISSTTLRSGPRNLQNPLKCGALPVGYNFVALVALIILCQNTK